MTLRGGKIMALRGGRCAPESRVTEERRVADAGLRALPAHITVQEREAPEHDEAAGELNHKCGDKEEPGHGVDRARLGSPR